MASIIGRVLFDEYRNCDISLLDVGISYVPIVLLNIETNFKLVVLTDINGYFKFINVAYGKYILVESYLENDNINPIGDFSFAIMGDTPIPSDPPIHYVPTAPALATNLDSLSPNTLLINVYDEDIKDIYFIDAPIKHSYLDIKFDEYVYLIEPNLIYAADCGTFGFYPPSTVANYSFDTNPFPYLTQGSMYYTKDIYDSGQFTFKNIFLDINNYSLWKLANKTTGDETSSMMIIYPLESNLNILFSQTVYVNANTNYLFSMWICNLSKLDLVSNTQIELQLLDRLGTILYSEILSYSIPSNTTLPEWIQLGNIIYTKDNIELTIKIINKTTSSSTNIFSIDDISLYEIIYSQNTLHLHNIFCT